MTKIVTFDQEEWNCIEQGLKVARRRIEDALGNLQTPDDAQYEMEHALQEVVSILETLS